MRWRLARRLERAQDLAAGRRRLRRCSQRSAGPSAATGSSRCSSSSGCWSPAPRTGTATGSCSGWSARASCRSASHPPLHASVQRLAAVAGLPKPRVYLLPDGLPRALAAGRGPRGGAIAVSRGLLGAAPPAELEGVLAHELAHIRNRDVLVQTAAVVVAAALIETSRIGGWLQRTLLFVLGPSGRGDRPPAALAEARVRGRPRGGRALRLAARTGRRADPARAGRGAGRVPCEPGDGAALHDQPVRRGRPGRPLRRRIRRSASASAGCERSTPTGARSCARPRTTKSRSRRPFVNEIVGGDLLSREVALRVPSARAGLTSLFGMGRGVPPPLSPPKLSRARVKRTLKTP